MLSLQSLAGEHAGFLESSLKHLLGAISKGQMSAPTATGSARWRRPKDLRKVTFQLDPDRRQGAPIKGRQCFGHSPEVDACFAQRSADDRRATAAEPEQQVLGPHVGVATLLCFSHGGGHDISG
jgi:hypothetical protein